MNQEPMSVSEYSEEKRKLCCWLVEWLNKYDNIEPINVDVPELSIILQILGFKQQKCNDLNHLGDAISVELKCKKSGMCCILTKTNVTCKCPPHSDVDRIQFGTFPDCVPRTQENINSSSTRSLIPTLSKLKSKTGAPFVISSAVTKQKQKDSTESSSFQRSFSLDTFQTPMLMPNGLKKQRSWIVDPKTTPPTQTSSPLSSLRTSLSEISSNSEQEKNLIENLKLIQKLATDSVAMVSKSKNATFTKIECKRVSDIKPEGADAFINTNRNPTPAIKMVTPKRITPKKFDYSNALININRIPTPAIKMVTPKRMYVTPKKFNYSRDKNNPVYPKYSQEELAQNRRIFLEYGPSPIIKSKTSGNIKISGVSKTPTLKSGANEKLTTKSRIASYVKLTPKLVYKH